MTERNSTSKSIINLQSTLLTLLDQTVLSQFTQELSHTSSIMTRQTNSRTRSPLPLFLEVLDDAGFEDRSARIVTMIGFIFRVPYDARFRIGDCRGRVSFTFRFNVGSSDEFGSERIVVRRCVGESVLKFRGSRAKVALIYSRRKVSVQNPKREKDSRERSVQVL